MSAATSFWRSCCLWLLAWLQSTISGGGQAGFFQIGAGGGHVGGIVVGRFATAQDDVAVLVASGVDDGHLAVFVHR